MCTSTECVKRQKQQNETMATINARHLKSNREREREREREVQQNIK